MIKLLATAAVHVQSLLQGAVGPSGPRITVFHVSGILQALASWDAQQHAAPHAACAGLESASSTIGSSHCIINFQVVVPTLPLAVVHTQLHQCRHNQVQPGVSKGGTSHTLHCTRGASSSSSAMGTLMMMKSSQPAHSTCSACSQVLQVKRCCNLAAPGPSINTTQACLL